MNEMLEWAQAYAQRGWYVFPVHGLVEDAEGGREGAEGSATLRCTCGAAHEGADRDAGKHPVMRNGLKGATRDAEKIAGWWGSEEGKHWNIGVRTGEVSGLTVLDVDIGEGKSGGETWAALTSEKGEPETLTAITGSGGAHALFKYNSALNTSSNTLGPGVDCRNDGGYIVAAPSRHRSGGRYSWVEIASPSMFSLGEGPAALATLPAHLSKRVETRGRKKDSAARNKRYTVEQVRVMLESVDAGDRDLWRSVGIVLGREFARADEAWEAYTAWSDSWGGAKGRNHDSIMREAFYELSTVAPTGSQLSMGTIVAKAIEGGWVPDVGSVDPRDLIYFAGGNNFFYRPIGSFWIAEAVNAAVGLVKDEAGNLMKAALWVQKNALATSMSKLPDVEEVYMKDFDARDGVLFAHKGGGVINTYRAADIEPGDARLAGPFVAHVGKVFPREGDADQFLNYMAHRAQKPGEKPRFALLIAGEQGTGKDTCVEFCVPAIGAWNVSNIEPSAFDTSFNAFAAATLVRISEAANLQDMNKWAFNERVKVLIAGNPDVVTINPKYGSQYDMRMFCGVIITTNHLATGIYIPPGDRRYDVIEAASRAEMGIETDEKAREYFGELWDWFGAGGAHHVAAFLFDRDLKFWSAANGQRKTEAHRAVVAAGMSSEHWLADAMDTLGAPALVRSDAILSVVEKDGNVLKKDASARLNTAMARSGYVSLRNHDIKDGRWKFDGKHVTVYFCPERMTEVEARRQVGGLRTPF